jgi:hypothetical protein
MPQLLPERTTMSELYEVFALKYGAHSTGRTRRDSFMLATDDHAVPHPIDYFVWVIKNDKRTIMVDTGFEEKEAALRGRKINAQPREILKHLGLAAEQVDHVIVSHLHYDHAGTLEHFPKARYHLQETEMAYDTRSCADPSPPITSARWCSVSIRAAYSSTMAMVRWRQASPCITRPGIPRASCRRA